MDKEQKNMKIITIGDNLFEIDYTEETADKIVDKIVQWVVENGATSSEIIMQTDGCIISAPELLSDIVDNILKPRLRMQDKTNDNYKLIYKRVYDNPYNPDGTEKENEILGEFKIIETLYEDTYRSQSIGILKNTDKIFIITEYEVCGYNGGSRFEVFECKSLKLKIII